MPIREDLRVILLAVGAIGLIGAGSNVHVPYATAVNVHVKAEVSSAHAQVGDAVPIEVVQDVVVNGYVVIARGADGLAQVAAVIPASATPGQVQLTFKWVHAVDGSKIGVVGQQLASGATNANAADPTASLNGVQKAVQDSGVNSASVNQAANQAASWISRFKKVAGDLGVSANAKANDGALEPDRTIALSIRNPNGVSILSSTRAASANDDSDVK